MRNIYEAKEGMIKATVEWLKENYHKFNKEFFDNKLPDNISFIVTKLNSHILGEQGFEIPYYYSKSSRDIYSYNNNKDDKNGTYLVKNIESLKPFIRLNNTMSYSLLELENTLLHEMVHLYVYYLLNHKQPNKVHGREFNKVSKEILKKSDGKYKITTYADQHGGEYELDDDVKQRIKERKAKNLSLIYFEFSQGRPWWCREDKNFVLTKEQNVENIIKEMKSLFDKEKSSGHYAAMDYSITVYNNVGEYFDMNDMVVSHTFRYYYYKDYAENCDKIMKNIKGEEK